MTCPQCNDLAALVGEKRMALNAAERRIEELQDRCGERDNRIAWLSAELERAKAIIRERDEEIAALRKAAEPDVEMLPGEEAVDDRAICQGCLGEFDGDELQKCAACGALCCPECIWVTGHYTCGPATLPTAVEPLPPAIAVRMGGGGW